MLGKTVSGFTNSIGELAGGFSLGKQSLIGNYKIRVSIDHPLGDDTKEVAIQVTNPIFITLSSGAGAIQYNAEPIKVTAFTTNADGNPEDIHSIDLSGTQCGTKSISQDSIAIVRKDRGEYELSTTITEECNMIWKAVAIDSGFRSAPASVTVQVKNSQIAIQPDFSKVQDKEVGRYTVSFKTLNSELQPINTNNIVAVIDSDACRTGQYCPIDKTSIPEITVQGSNGNYQFTHTYKDGLNEIEISSSAQNIQGSTQKFVINIFPCTSPSCTVTPPNGGGEGGIPIGLIVTIIIVVAGIGLFLWLVFRPKRK